MTNTSPVFYKLSLHTLSLKFTTVFQVFLNCSFKSFLWTSFRHTATHLRKLWLKWLDAHTHLVVNVLTYMPGGGRAYIHAWWWTCSRGPVNHTQHRRWTAMYKWWDLFPQCPVSTDPKLHRHNSKRKIPVTKLLYKLLPSCLVPSNAVLTGEH